MEQERRSLRWGIAAITVAALWRLGGTVITPAAHVLQSREAASALLFLASGRTAQAATESTQATKATEVLATESTQATEATPTQPPVPDWQQLAVPSVFNDPGKSFDARALMAKPLTWQLRQDAPTVLILHTHATEGYADTAPSYRSTEEDSNLLQVGAHLAAYLESQGISVIHDRTLHDYPAYNGSYNASRLTAQKYLATYPSLTLVLDLHRDAVELSDGSQMATTAGNAAQVMLVVGTDTNLAHPHWQENFSLALKLHALLEAETPGITRPIYLRRERFNQDLTTATLLVEVGAAGNTPGQALAAAEKLGQAIVTLATGG